MATTSSPDAVVMGQGPGAAVTPIGWANNMDQLVADSPAGWSPVGPPVIPATGATAGAPGTYTPAGATPPANLAALAGVTAIPATAWITGDYVVLGDATQAHWTGSAWAAGMAP